MASPYIRVDADGHLLGNADGKFDVDVAKYLNALRAGSSVASSMASGSTVVTPSDAELDADDVIDEISVTLIAGQTYTFAYRGTVDGVEDPYLAIRAPNGSIIDEDDDGGFGRTSMITFTASQDGVYTLLATSWYTLGGYPAGTDTGGYTIDQWSLEDDVDAGGTAATATSLTFGTTYGYVEAANDVDVYSVSLTAGQYYNFSFAGGAADGADLKGADGEIVARLQLLDGAGNIVATATSYESAFGFFAEANGTYFVQITPVSGDTPAGYTLDVEQIDPATRSPLDALYWESADIIRPNEGDGTTIYVYFANAGENFGELADNGHSSMKSFGWKDYEIDAVMDALNTHYTPVTGYTYAITTDPALATFRMITTTSEDYGAYAYPQDPDNAEQAGIVVFNRDSGGFYLEDSLDQGGFSYAVILHELGHAHGLAHPHDDGGGSEVLLGVTDSTGSFGIYDLNQGVYTVMSYNDAFPEGPGGESPYTKATIGYGWSGSLSAFDIAALQIRYGTGALANNVGNDSYALADVNASGTYFQTILDTGGIDEITYGGARDAHIDLLAATLDYSPTGGGVVSMVEGVFGGYTIANGSVIENATSGSGDDALLGNAAANRLDAGAGDDTLMGRGGNDNLVGGTGNDTASYDDAAASVTVDLAAGTSGGGDGNDILSGIENVIGSAFDDQLSGDGGGNVLTGGRGNDTLDGRGGVDTASYATATGAVIASLAAGTASGAAGSDTLIAIENLVGSDYGDTLTGDGLANVITGGLGNDTIVGGGGIDTASYADASGKVAVNLAAGTATGAAGNDMLSGVENVIGSAFNDSFIGTSGANDFQGGSGADTLSYANATAGVTINLAAGTAVSGGVTDTFSSIETVIGSAFVDRIVSGDAMEVITLGGGNDVFVADVDGTERATKYGSLSIDIITDFDGAGNDVIDLRGLNESWNWRGDATNKRDGDVTFKSFGNIGAAESALGIDIDGVEGAGGVGGPVTVVFGNTDGGTPDFAIVLLNTASVDPADFLFY